MASFKPIIRASQQPPDQPQPENSKYRAQAKQLQELFPTWSFDDLHSLLTEVTGDVELAATRISEGHAEQWGSVTRKKDKKAPGSAKEAAHSSTRGGRGGRGGARGGLPGRGGSSARGRGGPPRGAPNGHLGRSASPRVNSPAPPQPAAAAASHVSEPVPESDVKQNGGEISGNGWAETSSASANAWANAASEPSPPQTNGTAQHHHNVIAPKPTKTPATSKMSWAQIARQQEKPTPPPPAPVVAPAPPPVEKPIPAPVQEPEPVPLREEPTTVQPPTWDDEPPSKPPAVEAVSETWPTEEPQPEPVVEEAQPEPEVVPEPVPEPKEEPAPKPQPPSALPAQLLQQHKDLSLPSLPSTPPAIAAIATPSPKPAQARPSSAAHRASARFKIGEQPAVVMPSSFSAGIEKVGMQFGSLNIGGDNVDAIPTEPSVPEPVAIPAVPEPEPTPAPAASVQAPAEPPALPPPVTPSAPPVPPAHTPTSISSSALFQPTLPRQTPPQPTQPPQLTTSVSQPISSSAQVSTSLPAATSSISVSPAQQYPSQSSVGLHLQQQQQHHQNSLPQQLQQQPAPQHHQQHQFSQHSLPSHVDTQPTSHQQQPQQQPQNAVNAAASAAAGHGFFRGAADPFFHTPTPPAPQPQESAYGAFGQLGQQMQHQAQAQASHLGSFGGDYGYGDNQRGFYDSYGQQAGFNGRNTLGHDDMKGGPVSQQPASNVGISATASQTSQHSAASQASVQPQAVAGQAPQQYPPPLPYYYNPYPQNQFYGTPYNSGYGVHNYVKYPAAMFAGGPASGPTPTAKQPGNVQPQSNPYGQGLYTQHQQHPSASYEEIGYQHHNQQPHGLSAGLPSNEYGKQQLYGGQGGFMGLGQSNGPSGGVRNTGGGSPETPYKPYAPKDVGGGVGGGMGVNQGIQGGRAGSVQGQQPSQVGQSQGQGQPQQGQGNFYSNRYAANAGAGVGVGAGVGGPQGQAAHHLHQPQGQGPQSHLAYPQGGSEANFYSYQARQQGYWPQ